MLEPIQIESIQSEDNAKPRPFEAHSLCNDLTDAQAWTMDATELISPKIIVRTKTTKATQNVHHWTMFLRSYHHCWMVEG